MSVPSKRKPSDDPMQKADGMNYAPEFSGQAEKVVGPGEFRFSVIGLDHGHIFAMTNGLLEAGAEIRQVYDPDESKVRAFIERYPAAAAAESEEEILASGVQLVASAVRPDMRGLLSVRIMKAGKCAFVDKPGFLTVDDLKEIEKTRRETGMKYYIYFGERVHVEGAVCAEKLIDEGKVGRVLNVTNLAPHRLNAPTRPGWFWDCGKNGSILIDLGSHQIEQFLTYSGSKTGRVVSASMKNFANPEHPDFYDFGDCHIEGDSGATCYFRVDWFTPDGMGAWGDGRTFVTGTDGCIEVRKYIDVARSSEADHVYFTDAEGEHLIEAHGKYGFEYFGKIILDCLKGTDDAIDPAVTLEAMRLAIEAAEIAKEVTRDIAKEKK